MSNRREIPHFVRNDKVGFFPGVRSVGGVSFLEGYPPCHARNHSIFLLSFFFRASPFQQKLLVCLALSEPALSRGLLQRRLAVESQFRLELFHALLE